MSLNKSRDEIMQVVSVCLAEVLDLESIILDENSTAEQYEDWDSVNHVRLLIAIEQVLGFQFSPNEISLATNVGQLIDLIQLNISKKCAR